MCVELDWFFCLLWEDAITLDHNHAKGANNSSRKALWAVTTRFLPGGTMAPRVLGLHRAVCLGGNRETWVALLLPNAYVYS